MTGSKRRLRTRVYVDGYNLYHGRLKRTLHKWLDLHALFLGIFPTILHRLEDGTPAEFVPDPLFIKYFTAPILSNFASANDSVECQKTYHDALRCHLGDAVSVIEGYYDARKARAIRCENGKKPHACEKIEVWKLEEKQSDVAMAVHALRDAMIGAVDHVVIVTNDTDIAPALEMIREHTAAVVGLIVPTRDTERWPNRALSDRAHWTRDRILDAELAASQLPTPVRGASKTLHKPISWYPNQEQLQQIFAEAKRVRRSNGAAWKWLNTANARFGDRRPIDMAATAEGAKEVLDYMANYAQEFRV